MGAISRAGRQGSGVADTVASLLSNPNTNRQAGHNCLTLYHTVRVWQQRPPPPVAEFSTGDVYIPVQKIFAKVKLITPLTCGYIYCDTTHICKTGNALNFLPYI